MKTKTLNQAFHVHEQITPIIIDRKYQHHGVKITICDGYEYTNPSVTYKNNRFAIDARTIEAEDKLCLFNERFSYFNNGYVPVTVKTRGGATLTLDVNQTNLDNPHVLIRKEITVKGTALNSLCAYLSSIQISLDEIELKILKQELTNLTGIFQVTIHIDYVVPMKDFALDKFYPKEGTIYVPEADVVISLRSTYECPNHPMSSRNMNRHYFGKSLQQSLSFNPEDAYVVYRYINRDKKASPLYLYDGHTVIKLIPVVDTASHYRDNEMLEIGYSARNYEGEDKVSNVGMMRILYTLEEAKQIFSIVSNPNDLKYVLLDEERLKKETIILQQKLNVGKLEIEEAKLKIEKLKAENNEKTILIKEQDEKQSRIDKMERDIRDEAEKKEERLRKEYEHKLKVERDKLQEERDKRKDQYDIIKSCLALIGSAIGIFMLYKKTKK